jgi:hypothetical protein
MACIRDCLAIIWVNIMDTPVTQSAVQISETPFCWLLGVVSFEKYMPLESDCISSVEVPLPCLK